MAKRKVKRWWVSRDRVIKSISFDFYNIHHSFEKPEVLSVNAYPSCHSVMLIRGREFRKAFKLILQEGECKEIERPTLVLKAEKKEG